MAGMEAQQVAEGRCNVFRQKKTGEHLQFCKRNVNLEGLRGHQLGRVSIYTGTMVKPPPPPKIPSKYRKSSLL
jgi:hypothetical protein